MTPAKATVIIFVMVFGTIAGLVYLAINGEIWATGILFSVWSIVCVLIGASIVMRANRNRDAREQANFTANIQENLAIMRQIQALQNAQNTQLIKQVAKLPKPQLTMDLNDVLLVDDSVFEELDQ